jgi:hypothetical protein
LSLFNLAAPRPTILSPGSPSRPQVSGDPASPTSKLIRELTYAEFCQLAPINNFSGAAYVQTAAGPTSTLKEEVLGSSPSSSTSSSSRLSESSSSSNSEGSHRHRLLRKLHNHSPAVPGDVSLVAWDCTEEDHFPTLEQVGGRALYYMCNAVQGGRREPLQI